MKIAFSLCLPRDEASVPVVRRLCASAMEKLGVQDGCISDVEIAVTEACTNVLKHTTHAEDEYDVDVEITDDALDIRVTDKGAGFDHGVHGHEPAQLSAERGRGLHLMRVLVDDLKFASDPGRGTVVYLSKALALKEDALLRRLAATPEGRVAEA